VESAEKRESFFNKKGRVFPPPTTKKRGKNWGISQSNQSFEGVLLARVAK
jgi:hypothetical protein